MAHERSFNFDEAPNQVRQSDPQTSKDAVRYINQKLTERRELIVWILIQENGSGLPCHTIASRLGFPRDYISSNFRPLEIIGVIKKIGEVINENTNKSTEVWGLTDEFKFSKKYRQINSFKSYEMYQGCLSRSLQQKRRLDRQIEETRYHISRL